MKKIVIVKLFGFRAETHAISVKFFNLFDKVEDCQLILIEFFNTISRDCSNEEFGLIIIKASSMVLKRLSKILAAGDFLSDKKIIFVVNKIYQPRIHKSSG